MLHACFILQIERAQKFNKIIEFLYIHAQKKRKKIKSFIYLYIYMKIEEMTKEKRKKKQKNIKTLAKITDKSLTFSNRAQSRILEILMLNLYMYNKILYN